MKPRTTPKDFFLWFGSAIALIALVFSFINLLFGYIDFVFPDPLSYPPDPYNGSMRWDMAALVVLFPLFIILQRIIGNDARSIPEKKELWVRRWVVVGTIFLAGAAVAVDLIVLLSGFLGGELTLPFIFKVAVVLLVAGGLFLHSLAYLRGYWESHGREARSVGWTATATIVLALAAGFVIMGSPWDVRLYRFDEQKVADLRNIQAEVVNYWQQKEELPVSLAVLSDPISGFVAPLDPQTGRNYGYRVAGALSFELCATFNEPSATSPLASARVASAGPAIVRGAGTPDSWQHEATTTCFARTIDPKRYPPFQKK